jgi:2-phospho-L-lactate guanylyltransferase
MPIVAIPVRSFTAGKTRLQPELEPPLHRTLTEGMAARAVEAARGTSVDRVFVIAGSPEVRTWAAGLNLAVLDDPGAGLDRAVGAAIDVSVDGGSAWVILHADLPLVTAEALVPVVAAASEGPVIVPSYNGGTAVLGGREPQPLRYGPASFHHHLASAPKAQVIVDYRLAIDVDTRRDLEVAARLPEGTWLRPFLGSSG